MKTSKRILVYQIGNIGDTIVSIPSLKAVRKQYGPHARITILHDTRPEINVTPADLLSQGNLVNEFISYPYKKGLFGKLLSAFKLLWQLRQCHFQTVIYLAPSERTLNRVRRDKLFFRLVGIPERVGFHVFSTNSLYPVDEQGQPVRVQHEAFLRLERLGLDGFDIFSETDLMKPFLEIPTEEIERARQWLAARRCYSDRPLVAICPGAKQPANSWPLDRFIKIGQRLIEQNQFELLVVGGEAEQDMGESMIKTWGTGLNAAGQFSVLGSAALFAQCVFLIGLDTGTTHLAASQGVPCIALYGGRVNPGHWEPLGQGHRVLRSVVPCAGCRLRNCPIQGHPCMTQITVEEVWEAIMQLELNDKLFEC
ncbi:glycosyltransferase family 9 protein [Candidatus Latescibacterota bacterium]